MRTRLSLPKGENKTASIREEVKTRTDNPLLAREEFGRLGLAVDALRFVRFFAAPPFCGNENPAIATRTIELEKELSSSWIGHVTASSYLVKSVKTA